MKRADRVLQLFDLRDVVMKRDHRPVLALLRVDQQGLKSAGLGFGYLKCAIKIAISLVLAGDASGGMPAIPHCEHVPMNGLPINVYFLVGSMVMVPQAFRRSVSIPR